MKKNYVHEIAMLALTCYAEELKDHPNYGWVVYNYAGQNDYNPARRDMYCPDNYGFGYSFADAVTIAADSKRVLPNNDIWVEPLPNDNKDMDICRWIVANNLNNRDETTIENVSAGRRNVPGGGISYSTYDEEYAAWAETIP